MNYNNIVNLETGRKVSIYGSIGQQILKNYVISYQLGGSARRQRQRRKFSKRRAELAEYYEYNIPDSHIRTIRSRAGKKYLLLIFEGEYYRKQDDHIAMEGIITSNQHEFTEDNWRFADGRGAFLRVNARRETILPKVKGSYSGILIDPENLFRSNIPKIVGYIICTKKTNPNNGFPYIYIDYVELHRTLGIGRGLCTPMIYNMINWFIEFDYRFFPEGYPSFKIYNASYFGLAARKCYLRAGIQNGCSISYYPGVVSDWIESVDEEYRLSSDLSVEEDPFNIEGDGEINPMYDDRGNETYFMVKHPPPERRYSTVPRFSHLLFTYEEFTAYWEPKGNDPQNQWNHARREGLCSCARCGDSGTERRYFTVPGLEHVLFTYKDFIAYWISQGGDPEYQWERARTECQGPGAVGGDGGSGGGDGGSGGGDGGSGGGGDLGPYLRQATMTSRFEDVGDVVVKTKKDSCVTM